jgi:hypothetical protein
MLIMNAAVTAKNALAERGASDGVMNFPAVESKRNRDYGQYHAVLLCVARPVTRHATASGPDDAGPCLPLSVVPSRFPQRASRAVVMLIGPVGSPPAFGCISSLPDSMTAVWARRNRLNTR